MVRKGGEELFEVADQFENKIRQKKYPLKLKKEFYQSLSGFIKTAQTLNQGKDSKAPAEELKGESWSKDSEKLLTVLSNLKTMIKRGAFEADKAFEELTQLSKGAPGTNLLNKLEQELENFDFDQASKMLDELIILWEITMDNKA